MSLRRRLVVALLLLVVVVLSAVAVYLWFGGPDVTLLDAFYMAVITVTTVGYGEIVDTRFNPGLRLFNIFFILDWHRDHAVRFFRFHRLHCGRRTRPYFSETQDAETDSGYARSSHHLRRG